MALLLCATVAWPGTVREADLDARWINVLPALGVGIALPLIGVALRATGSGSVGAWTRGDGARLIAGTMLVACALPWIFADVGVPVRRPSLVGRIFLSDQLRTQPGDSVPHPAVHLGVHHGLYGTLLVLTALALSRQLGRVTMTRMRLALGLYLSLMLVYGLANAAEDWELEQIVKRGWTTRELPSVLQPGPTLAWATLIVAAVCVYLLVFRPREHRPPLADAAASASVVH